MDYYNWEQFQKPLEGEVEGEDGEREREKVAVGAQPQEPHSQSQRPLGGRGGGWALVRRDGGWRMAEGGWQCRQESRVRGRKERVEAGVEGGWATEARDPEGSRGRGREEAGPLSPRFSQGRSQAGQPC